MNEKDLVDDYDPSSKTQRDPFSPQIPKKEHKSHLTDNKSDESKLNKKKRRALDEEHKDNTHEFHQNLVSNEQFFDGQTLASLDQEFILTLDEKSMEILFLDSVQEIQQNALIAHENLRAWTGKNNKKKFEERELLLTIASNAGSGEAKQNLLELKEEEIKHITKKLRNGSEKLEQLVEEKEKIKELIAEDNDDESENIENDDERSSYASSSSSVEGVNNKPHNDDASEE